MPGGELLNRNDCGFIENKSIFPKTGFLKYLFQFLFQKYISLNIKLQLTNAMGFVWDLCSLSCICNECRHYFQG